MLNPAPQHLTSYPVVSDGISTFKNNAYGRKSIDLGTNGYEKFVKPMTPYLSRPYSIIAPYVAKADSLGDAGLSKIDGRVPIVKEDTKKVQETIYSYAHLPFDKIFESRNYLLSKYGEEYKKCGGDSYLTSVKALISTGILVGSDAVEQLGIWYNGKKAEAKEVAKDKTGN